ncbi:unnamed protein product [Phaedon cochleariae]|uniref:Uncharacterized protein n=1 Tax=Phaedon cochleariae TaxID=80249 RepID=A0A9N9SIP7_PHACE|nr:unnamed protein product [Phaedon cochleariae]
MFMDLPLVGTSVPTIPEESRESTPVVIRRDSSDKASDASVNAAKTEAPQRTPVAPRRNSSSAARLAKQRNSDSVNNGFAGTESSVATVSSKASSADERLAQRRKSLVPMSSMEEENLRERLRLAQLRQCSVIVHKEARYTRDTFRRLFQNKVRILCVWLSISYFINQLNVKWLLKHTTFQPSGPVAQVGGGLGGL